MKVDSGISNELANAATSAKQAEAAGYDGAWAAETSHDPFMPLAIAAEHTTRLELGTSIAVAFARNPMNLAHIAWDLQAYSKGRFILGLGSQIKPHITKRFSMEWSHPAPRMREMVMAIRAIWDTWLNGAPLAFDRTNCSRAGDDAIPGINGFQSVAGESVAAIITFRGPVRRSR